MFFLFLDLSPDLFLALGYVLAQSFWSWQEEVQLRDPNIKMSK